jgi:hypothetical protein
MPERAIEAELVMEVVICGNCRQKNRLHKQTERGDFKCGGCRNRLPDPFERNSLPGAASNTWKFVGFGVLTFIGLMVIVSIFSGRGRTSSASTAPGSASGPIKAPTQAIVAPLNRSLPFSIVLVSPAITGPGLLKVSNGMSRDTYIKLVEPVSQTLLASFYVKSHSPFTLDHISDGSYQVLFASGEDWDSLANSFTRSKTFARFDRSLDFTSTQRTDETHYYTEYATFELTLHPVVGGNAKTSGLSEEEFNRY